MASGHNDVGQRNLQGIASLTPGTGEIHFQPRLQQQKEHADPADRLQHVLLNRVRRENRLVNGRKQPAENRRPQNDPDEDLRGDRGLFPPAKDLSQSACQAQQQEDLHQENKDVLLVDEVHHMHYAHPRPECRTRWR